MANYRFLSSTARLAFCTLIITALTACASSSERSSQSYPTIVKAGNKPIPKSQQAKATALQQQLRAWEGTPYRYGGLSRRGIDCSGFIHVAFRDAFGLNMPRSTALLSKTGYVIPQNKLSVGDLVFFKTGFKQRHVGIYVGNRQFIHASTSKGVMKSNLNNPYWSKAYWKSHRVLDI